MVLEDIPESSKDAAPDPPRPAATTSNSNNSETPSLPTIRTSSPAGPARAATFAPDTATSPNIPRATSGATREGRSISGGRSRGRSLSNSESAQLAHLPTHNSGRPPSNDGPRGRRNSELDAIPESRATSPVPADDFISPGLRKRATTWRTVAGGAPRRGATIRRRPTINTGVASGSIAAGDEFSLAGVGGPAPAVQIVQEANAPYVDPGYTQLNPSYDQPENVRPVWGLAKPLPRVLRPGMIPTRSEFNYNQNQTDLEQGNSGEVDATLNIGRIATQLEETRRRRENSLMQAISPGGNGLGRQSSTASHLSPFPNVDEDENDLLGMGRVSSFRPNDDMGAIPEKVEGQEETDGSWGEELTLDQDWAADEEIHNLHTHWSVVRLQFREPFAELLAVVVQLTIGFCADLAITLANSSAGGGDQAAWAWGLATMIGIYIAGGISGAHLNPAISIMLWIFRGFPLRKLPGYIIAQLLGAFIAAFIAFGIYQEGIIEFGGVELASGGSLPSFVTYPRYTYIGGATAFFSEFVGTAFLAISVMAMGDDTNAPPGAGMSAFVLGLTITALTMALGYNTGLAMNPSRDFGPRLALLCLGYGSNGKLFNNTWWFYGPWVATISGALVGAFFYDAAIFVGGESPVNYPKSRFKRAGKKWKRKWGGRVKRTVLKVRRKKKTADDESMQEGKAKANY